MEREPQNVPGTGNRYPNWRRKTRYSLEEFSGMSQIVSLFKEVNRLRDGD